MVTTVKEVTQTSDVQFGYNEDRKAKVLGLTSDDLYRFNRYNLPTGSTFMGGLKGYVFFTRPDLNLFKPNNSQDTVDNVGNYLGALGDLKGITSSADWSNYSALQSDTPFQCPFIPILSNNAKNYSPEDQSIDIIEQGETNWGSKIKYGRHGVPSRSAGSFNITFSDTKDLHVYKLISLWTDYIENVYLGFISPKMDYIYKKILDYAVSMYYIVLRQDGREVVYWEKLVGVFPKNRPDSAFATNTNNFTYPEFNIQFEYSLKSKGGMLDPNVIYEFNKVAMTDKRDRSLVANNYVTDQGIMDYVITPYIKRGDPSKFSGEQIDRFYLDWVQYIKE